MRWHSFQQNLLPPESSLWILLFWLLKLTVLSAISGPPGRHFGTNHYQKLSSFGFQQPVWSSKRSTVCVSLHSTLLLTGETKLYSKAGLLIAQDARMVSKRPQVPQALPLPTFTCSLAVTLNHWKVYFWKDFRQIPVSSQGEVQVWYQGKWWVCFTVPELLWECPKIFPCPQMGRDPCFSISSAIRGSTSQVP